MTLAATETPQDDPPVPAPADDRMRWRIGLAVVLALAFLLRLLYLHQVAQLPIFDQPVADSAAHLGRASEIAAGRLLPASPIYYCSIFYPYFLALILGPFHGSLFVVGLVQILAGTVVVALLAMTARALFGPLAGLAAGACAALYGPFAFFETDVLGVVWGQLALAVGMLACVRWVRHSEPGARHRMATLLAAGVAFGLAVVERPNLLIVVAAVTLWCAVTAGAGRAMRSALALGVGAVLPVLVVLGLNVAGTGQWVPLTTSAGINLSLAYHPGATGTYDEPWEREAPEFSARHVEPEAAMIAWASRKMGRPLSAMQASDYWRREAIAYIRAHPGATMRLLLFKTGLLLNGTEVANHLNFEFIRERAWALQLMPIGFGGVFPLAVLGLAHALRRRRERAGTVLMGLVGLGAMLGVVLFTVADRYRAPMVLPLIVLAGAGVAMLADVLRVPDARRDRRLPMMLGLGLAAALIALLPLAKSLRGRDHWMFARAYQAQGRLPEAIAAYEAGAREEPNNGPLLNNLATAYRQAGRRDDALTVLRRVVAIEPRLSYPHKNLGMLLIGMGDFGGAMRELQRAHAIDPRDAEVLGAIGALHAERGDRAAATESFARAIELAPNDARLRSLIAHYRPAQPGKAGG